MRENEGIKCQIFQNKEPKIKEITDRINIAKTVVEKVKWAEELQQEVNILMSCIHYDKKSIECNNCLSITNLRKKTANLITKAKKLA